MEEFLTIRKVSRILGVTPQTLRNWEKKGIFVPYRNPVNNYRVYKTSQVNSLLEKMKDDRTKHGTFKLQVRSMK